MFTKYEVCTPLNTKAIKVSLKKTDRLKNMLRRLPGFVPSYLGGIAPLMPISSSAKSKLFTSMMITDTDNDQLNY